MNTEQKLRIGIVAGEASGDLLGAALIGSIKSLGYKIEVIGIGGDSLEAEGCQSLFPMERLSVMGLLEVAKRYIELRGIQNKVCRYFLDNRPDIFIGIDAPDFNLPIERNLHNAGIKTVHYVSPSVWAWRQGRTRKIAKSVDLMLALFPFEKQFYKQHQVPVEYVGHPIAAEIPLQADSMSARKQLGVTNTESVLAILPGSRTAEIENLAACFMETGRQLQEFDQNCRIFIAVRNEKNQMQFEQKLEGMDYSGRYQVIVGQTRQVLAAADAVLLASGTATLETMLMKKPMVVAYKANPITYKIISSMLKIPYVSLPNLLAAEPLVEEYLQSECTVDNLLSAIKRIWPPSDNNKLLQRFHDLHEQLIHSDKNAAAKAVLELLK